MHWLVYLLIINGLIGAAMLEKVLSSVRGFKADEARDSKFPLWRRHDTHNWNRRKLYLGAVTFMPIRVVCALGSIAILSQVTR